MLPTSSSDGGFGTLLKNRPFLALWTAQVLSQVADKIFFVFLIALLVNYQPPPGLENSARSALMFAITLPAILFGSAAGIFVDRFDKRQILVGCNLLRGLLILAMPLLPREFAILLIVGFSESVLTQFFAPAEQAAIPLLVPPQGLMSANALFTTTLMGSLIVGFAIGEPLLTLAKTITTALIGSLTVGFAIGEPLLNLVKTGELFGQALLVGGLYLVGAAILYCLPLRKSGADPQIVQAHPWHDFKAGLTYLKKDRLVSSAMVQLMILYSVFAALTVLAIDLVEEIGLKSTQFGFLLAAAGIGMVFGGAALGHWGDRFHHKPLPLIGFLIMAGGLTVFTFTNNLWLGLSLSALLGVGASMVGIPMQTLIQRQTPESMRGKVFGFQNNVVNIALSVPLAIAGPLTDAVGLRVVMLSMGTIVSLVGLWAWRSTRRVLQDVI
ncbi:MFS transporter [Stenomitos frigidus]|uniref:MFS transporter n=1 Tax=Stenomitos frigidus ULC18 TaxID=2107698 RepID=A0A2T1ESN0_9CYAN|nr:MFS transporter [Stenomitos frigidus]PSB35711.1 MFS transporter [Stenomitos frigidus ULC18]